MSKPIKYKKVTSPWIIKLASFFQAIVINKEDQLFCPHPLNFEQAGEIATYEGQDLYFLQTKDEDITGYGMLRGWDEGYSVPSLGIAIHPGFRRQGLAKKFMDFLHQRAVEKGAERVRLSVFTHNIAAINLYRSLGYTFDEEKNHKTIGICELAIK
jgi:ribosomal protein S18 acetylase RimI-like enzyme